MTHLSLFTDGSVNTKTKIGYGATLCIVNESRMEGPYDVKLKRFENTSSTKLELQCLLWALEDVKTQYPNSSITIYTDSQNIVGLMGRRAKLERNHYYSAKGKRLNNYELYQRFYLLVDSLDCNFVKVSGHMPSRQKSEIDQLFTLVDKASRRALRESGF